MLTEFPSSRIFEIKPYEGSHPVSMDYFSAIESFVEVNVPIFVLNYSLTEDRTLQTELLMQSLGISGTVTFVPATAFEDIDVLQLQNMGFIHQDAVERIQNNKLIPDKAAKAAISIAMDHLRIIQAATDDEHMLFGIFSDDFLSQLSPLEKENVTRALRSIPPSADVLYLRACSEAGDVSNLSTSYPLWARSFAKACSGPAFYTRKGARLASKIMNPIFWDIESMHNAMIRANILEVYEILPQIFDNIYHNAQLSALRTGSVSKNASQANERTFSEANVQEDECNFLNSPECRSKCGACSISSTLCELDSGQIELSKMVVLGLEMVSRADKPLCVMEVGTANGRGTTKALFSALQHHCMYTSGANFSLFTYEGLPSLFEEARRRWSGNPNVVMVNELVMDAHSLEHCVMPNIRDGAFTCYEITADSRNCEEEYFKFYSRWHPSDPDTTPDIQFFRTAPNCTLDLVLIDSTRFAHAGIIQTIFNVPNLASADTVFLIEDDFPEAAKMTERGIIERYFELGKVHEAQPEGQMWPWLLFQVQRRRPTLSESGWS